jgi:hypothetical protein
VKLDNPLPIDSSIAYQCTFNGNIASPLTSLADEDALRCLTPEIPEFALSVGYMAGTLHVDIAGLGRYIDEPAPFDFFGSFLFLCLLSCAHALP